ncbi:MAG: hypothetical protein D3910_23800 [Candidatus Electrothrix sp. ATG2]|nr:hypothetical protein [Candidatus Electrothrix sp. ATG2]
MVHILETVKFPCGTQKKRSRQIIRENNFSHERMTALWVAKNGQNRQKDGLEGRKGACFMQLVQMEPFKTW